MKFNGFNNVKYKKFKIDGLKKTTVDGKNSFAYDELSDWDGALGLIVPPDIVVVDCDDNAESEILLSIVKKERLKCYCSKSKRGYHFYFRIPRDTKIKNEVKASLPICLGNVDFRSGQRMSLSIERRGTEWNEWLEGFAPRYEERFEGFPLRSDDLDQLPIWLTPLRSTTISLAGLSEGDGRNDELNRLKWRLAGLSFKERDIEDILLLVNEYVFKTPLDNWEFDIVARFDEKMGKVIKKNWFDEEGRFKHNELAEFLAESLYMYKDCFNTLYYFDGEKFSANTDVIEQNVAENFPGSTHYHRQEVIKYMKLITNKSTIQPELNHSFVVCNNGLLNAKTTQLMNFTPSYFIKNKLDVKFIPDAYDEHVDKFLDDVLVKCGDKEQRDIFEEYLGYTLFTTDNKFKKMLLMIGPLANNGKSTTLAMIQNLLGFDNYSNVKLTNIDSTKNKFRLAQMADKLGNIDDEGDSTYIKGETMSILKTIISDNNIVTVEDKFKTPIRTFIRSKLWVASNHILKTEQKGDEWMTRLLILSFNNVFNGDKRDVDIKYKLHTENAKSYLLNLALKGYERLLHNKAFTKSKESEKWTEQYQIENDSVYYFYYKNKDMFNIDNLKGKYLTVIYDQYKNFLEEEDNKYPCNLNTFEKRTCEWFKNKVRVDIEMGKRIIKKIGG